MARDVKRTPCPCPLNNFRQPRLFLDALGDEREFFAGDPADLVYRDPDPRRSRPVRAPAKDKKLTALLELESAIYDLAVKAVS
jgi:hypothetical protein